MNHVMHTRVWASAICMGRKHRSTVFLSPTHFKEIHERVQWHASFSYIKKNRILSNDIIRNALTKDDRSTQNPGFEEETELLAAKRMDSYSAIFFAENTQHLHDCGYCVLEGFLDDRKLSCGDTENVPEFERFIQHMYAKFPGEGAYASRNWTTPPPWYPIVNLNTVQDTQDQERGIGRYMTSRRGIVDDLENGTAMDREMAVIKSKVEARLGQIAVSLRLNKHEGKQFQLKAPNTGMRLLLTGRGCPRQIPHIDFPMGSDEGLEPFQARMCNSYAMIHTGEDPGDIAIFVDSHRYSKGPETAVQQLSKTLPPVKVNIPPYSVIILRGELHHAGLGFEDGKPEQVKRKCRPHPVRGHMYMTLWNTSRLSLRDAIHFGLKFSPS